MKVVTLYPNPYKPHVAQFATDVLKKLLTLGIQVYIPKKAQSIFADFYTAIVVSEQVAFSKSEMIIIIGGDGSILRNAREAAIANVPMLGINTGNLGFLSELEENEINLLDDVLTGKYSVDERMMLDITVLSGKTAIAGLALNEVIIGRGDISHIINVNVSCKDSNIIDCSCDGVIFSTPTGSTAYSMSSGGPIVEPNADCMIVTPICPHRINTRPIVMSSERVIVSNAYHLCGKSAYVFIDGYEKIKISEDDLVVIKKSTLKTKLIRVNGRSFYKILNRKFFSDL